MWGLDRDNPKARQMPIDLLRKTLQEEHGPNGMALERVIEYELSYRESVAAFRGVLVNVP